jgi:glycine/D-amino acid oxidase-like deaminating enzyme/nitrite reductase/ring-hydroxylating ferredoxin subunit
VQAGKSVAVLEDGAIGRGQTQQTTAHLSCALDDRYFVLQQLHGEEGAQLAAESHRSAIDQIQSIVARERIRCEFQRLDGYLFVPPGESDHILDLELEAAHRAGLSDVELLPQVPNAPYPFGRCLRFPRQGQFNPAQYLRGLVRAVQQGGGLVYTNTHAMSVEGGDDARVVTRNGPVVTASSAVVATNAPINDKVAIHTKQAAYRTYVVALRVPAGSVPKALYWDTGNAQEPHPRSYHYIRLQKMRSRSGGAYDLLIVGGEDHRSGQSQDVEQRHARLEAWARERFPMAEQLEYCWSGQVMEPTDGLAFIGTNPGDSPNIYVVTGDSGHGMTHGTIAGMLLTDLILGKNNRWAQLYEPSRKMLTSIGDYARENLKTVLQYAEWLTGGDVESTVQVPRNSGAIIRRGLAKHALYRDEQGQLHEFSATCPHLGCVVQWNEAEKTWDCPCHGSRFDCLGRVINGPANEDLTAAKPAASTTP